MTNANFIELAISEVRKYVLNHLDKSDGTPIFDIFVVWSCKTTNALSAQHYTTGCITNAHTMAIKTKCILTHTKSLKTKKLFAKARNNYYDLI